MEYHYNYIVQKYIFNISQTKDKEIYKNSNNIVASFYLN